jgi:hypothetical protein
LMPYFKWLLMEFVVAAWLDDYSRDQIFLISGFSICLGCDSRYFCVIIIACIELLECVVCTLIFIHQ